MSLEVAVRNPERYYDFLMTYNKFEGVVLNDENILNIFIQLYLDGVVTSKDLDKENLNYEKVKNFVLTLSHNNEWGFPTGYQAAFTRYLKTLSEFGLKLNKTTVLFFAGGEYGFGKDNTFKIIGIKESWYKSGGDDENVCYKNSLPSIDLVTSRFLSREDMQKRLNEFSKDEIAELIKDVTGGESAASVLADLNAYKSSNDSRVSDIEGRVEAIETDVDEVKNSIENLTINDIVKDTLILNGGDSSSKF